MSLINKMLRDLDRRHQPFDAVAGPATEGMSRHAHPVQGRSIASNFFWRFMAAAMLFAVGWVAWVVWQLTPHSVVTDLAYQSPAAAKLAAPVAVAPPAAPKAEPAPAPPRVAEAPAAPAARPGIDMLRLATALARPIPERHAAVPRARPAPAQKTAAAEPVGAVPVAGEGKIDRRANTSAKSRAEQEFRRAVALVNQGRVAEAMDGFRSALELDPQHEAARQTLVALLLEAKRVDEAAVFLQTGLSVNPDNTAFAMLLARIMVERSQVPEALAVLQRHAAPPDRNPDFHAFAGALYQRLGRHKEAIDQYESALRLAPSSGVWWVGLGISLQASERPKDAVDAYARAKAAGLAPELLAFVDQRLKQLQ
jgi:MSHA biogenesis protein MshN